MSVHADNCRKLVRLYSLRRTICDVVHMGNTVPAIHVAITFMTLKLYCVSLPKKKTGGCGCLTTGSPVSPLDGVSEGGVVNICFFLESFYHWCFLG